MGRVLPGRAAAGTSGRSSCATSRRRGAIYVIDRWESADAYNAFVGERREEYMERVDATRFLYDSELRYGTFETLFVTVADTGRAFR